MQSVIWPTDLKMKFELCRISTSAALAFALGALALIIVPLTVTDQFILPHKILSVLLLIVNLERIRHLNIVKKKGIECVQHEFKKYSFLFCMSALLTGLIMLLTFSDSKAPVDSILSCYIIICCITSASASTVALVPRLQVFFLSVVFIMPFTAMLRIQVQSDIALILVPALMSAYLLFVIAYSFRFYKNMVKRFELENALQVEKENLRITINTLKEAENEVSKQKAKAEYASKMASLGQMAGGIAHEINTPLAIIHSYIELIRIELEGEKACPKKIDLWTGKIQGTTERIATIIRGLLSFSREGSRDPFERFQLQQSLEETLSFCRERFKVAGVELTVENLFPVTIEGRRVQISQVILNLLNNSYDAVKGRIEPKIKVQMIDMGSQVQISVEDNGGGVDSKIRDLLFEPFFTTKKIGQGTGLGLSVSHGIIEDHGGVLQLDTSTPHTRFYFSLPKAVSELRAN